MVANEDRLKVLKMIQENKITPEEGMELLELLDDQIPASVSAVKSAAISGQPGGRWLRVRITNNQTGKLRANVKLPISLVKAGIKMGARYSPELHNVDFEQFEAFINAGEIGPLVDVEDTEDGEHVEVSIE